MSLSSPTSCRPTLRGLRGALLGITLLGQLSCNSPTGGGDGTLQVTIAGLLGGANAAVQVTGPGTFTATLTGTQSLAGLTPGSYQVVAQSVGSGAQSWRPVAGSQEIVVAGGAVTRATVLYRLAGELVVVIAGLPADLPGRVEVSGQNGFVSAPSNSLILDQGAHTITASSVSLNGGTWNPTATLQNVTLAGGTTTTVTVNYQPVTGVGQVVISGLPGGAFPSATLTGPGGYTSPIASVGTNTFTNLTPGYYTATFATVVIDGSGWTTTQATQPLLITSGQVASIVSHYAATTGALNLVVNGLIGGALGSVTITGPDGYLRTVGTGMIIPQLSPGTYAIDAIGVPNNGNPLNPLPLHQSITIVAGARTTATVTYQPTSTLTLVVDGLYINQAAQSYDFTTPLIPTRPGLLRVFLKANEPNTARPDVRVRIYNGPTLVQTSIIPAPGASVPLAITEGTLESSWNLELPEGVIQAGMRLLVDVDPTAQVPLMTRSGLTWPTNGTPQTLDVRVGPTYDLTFLPVTQTLTGATGDVTAGNVGDFLLGFRRLHPVASYTVQMHAPIVFTGAAMNTADSSPWLALLAQVDQLRTVEGSARYYFGVVKVTSPTWSGFGYVPSNPAVNEARTAVGWDNLTGNPLGGASLTYAHELGHNVGLSHAPCGNPAAPDPNYPYPGAVTGVYGWDILDHALLAPSKLDFMSYCTPVWVSDFSYTRMFRAAPSASSGFAAPMVPQRVLIVSGTIANGRAALSPAFETFTLPSVTSANGQYRVQATNDVGGSIFDVAFNPTTVADVPGDVRHFTLAIPIGANQSLGQLRLVGPGVDVSIRAAAGGSGAASAPPTVAAVRLGGNRVRLTWDAARYPMVVVRESGNGSVLAFGSGGEVVVTTSGGPLTLILSEGLRSQTLSITP